MIVKLLLGAAPLLGGLVFLGVAIDAMSPLRQTVLWLGLQLASLGGAGIGLAAASLLAKTGRERWLLVAGMLFAWRVSYFPIMVFSGHVASIGEWLLALGGLPVFVYPTFLLAVAVLHAAATRVAGFLVAPPTPVLGFVAAGVFFLACCISFNQPRDLLPIPDTHWSLGGAAVPAMRAETGNPYAAALTGPGYWPNQRIVLAAAALTYETIPPSAWATTVKAVLEGLFEAAPFGSTRARVLEHYLAYHSAHPVIGCRGLDSCATFTPEAP